VTWFKIDDQWLRHPKTQALSKDAKLLWVAGGLHCASHLTDGVILKTSLRLIAAEADVRPTAVTELVKVGLWHDLDECYEIHQWLDYQPSRAEVEARREHTQEVKSKAGRMGNHARWHADRTVPGCEFCESPEDRKPIADVSQDPSQTPSQIIAPSRPVPSRPSVSTSQHSAAATETPPATAAAAAAVVVDPRTAEVIDIAVKVRQRQSQGEIRNPSRWSARVRENLINEHGATVAAALSATDDPDITGIVASITGAARTDVTSVRMGGGYL
jgi:hypothetical protein